MGPQQPASPYPSIYGFWSIITNVVVNLSKKLFAFKLFTFFSMPRGPSVTYKPTWERANLNTASRLSPIYFFSHPHCFFQFFSNVNVSKWFGKIKLYVVIAGIIPYVLYFEILFSSQHIKDILTSQYRKGHFKIFHLPKFLFLYFIRQFPASVVAFVVNVRFRSRNYCSF